MTEILLAVLLGSFLYLFNRAVKYIGSIADSFRTFAETFPAHSQSYVTYEGKLDDSPPPYDSIIDRLDTPAEDKVSSSVIEERGQEASDLLLGSEL